MARKNKKKPKEFHYLYLIVLALMLVGLLIVRSTFLSKVPILLQPPLKDLSTTRGVALGNHTLLDRLKDKPYASIVSSQYSFITIDGEAQWADFRPSATQYDYRNIDQLVDFAKTNKQSVQLHHLVWGETQHLPLWLRNGNYSSDQLMTLLHQHISSVVGHYKGQIAEWTVVNEAFTRAQHVYNLDDWWADHIKNGFTYIDDSFIWAHQADPNAKLILNDFNNEVKNNISDAQYDYIKTAKSRGVPIDGIGMQMHISASKPPSKAAVISNMQRFKALGVPTYITEFDVNVNSVKGNQAHKDAVEAQVTYDMVRACIESKACVSFDEFGVSDKNNTIKQLARTASRSYFFDSHYRPKASYYSFRQAWQQ